MRITLVHNASAGNGDLSASKLTRILTKAGHSVAYAPSKGEDLDRALAAATDLVVAAGGDGTVTKVATQINPERPVAILPIGSANNIAKSLGAYGPIDELVSSWTAGLERPFHLIAAHGPWGRRRIVEGVGFGALTHAIEKMRGHKPSLGSVRKVIRKILKTTALDEFQINLDAEAATKRFLIFEMTAVPLVGPNLLLAAEANPSDESFEICTLEYGEDQRDRFAKWLTETERVDVPAPISVRRVRQFTIAARFRKVRLNDHLWTDDSAPTDRDREISLETEARPLRFLVPGN